MASTGATRRVRLTRDSVCLADDVDAPHDGAVVVAHDATLVDLARAILHAHRWLPGVMSGSTWYIRHEGAAVVVAQRFIGSAVIPVRDASRAIGTPEDIHVYYASQEKPKRVAARLLLEANRTATNNAPA